MEQKAILTAKDLQKEPFNLSRCKAYQLMNDPNLPVIQLGKNKYLHAERFNEWLLNQSKPKNNED